ncbi:MAG: Lrp/AsnC ligand binding domain-containing protein [Gammaproteobacteria bacterium]|nr:Lrp/AsnC ligand binding domain-containing protein [Gammaproteobacteria bacterium]
MVTFIILINVDKNRITAVAEELADMPEITEVYSVTGIYDLVAIVRTRTNDDVAELVTSKLGAVEGIADTDTMLAFKTFSKHDLESMFSI